MSSKSILLIYCKCQILSLFKIFYFLHRFLSKYINTFAKSATPAPPSDSFTQSGCDVTVLVKPEICPFASGAGTFRGRFTSPEVNSSALRKCFPADTIRTSTILPSRFSCFGTSTCQKKSTNDVKLLMNDSCM